MWQGHPAREELSEFLKDPLSSGGRARNAKIVAHLLRDCPDCRLQLLTLKREAYRRGEAGLAEDYNRAFATTERALDAFCAQGQPGEASPEELFADLATLPEDIRLKTVMADRRFANPHLVLLLVEMGESVRYENTTQLLHLGDLARRVAGLCTVATVGSAPRLADLRSIGWRQYANALRVSGRLHEAENAFQVAQGFCKAGTGDPPARAALLGRLGSLRICQRRFAEAIALADEVGRIYSELGEWHSLATNLIQKSMAQIYAGEVSSAIVTLNRAIPLLRHDGAPQLLLAACHNLVRAYIEAGEPEQALSIFFEARSLYRDVQDPLITLRASWQEGQILRDLGHLRAAEGALLQARQGFLGRSLRFEVAVVSLDLASVYLRLGESEKLRETVAATVPIFSSLGVDRDALAALLQLQQADHQDKAALELIRFLSSRLEQLPQRA